MYYNFLKNAGDLIQITLEPNILIDKIRVDAIVKNGTVQSISFDSFYVSNNLNIRLSYSADITTLVKNRNNYNICVILQPLIQKSQFNISSQSEQNKIFSNLLFVNKHIDNELLLCPRISYANQVLNNVIQSQKTRNNTYISITDSVLNYNNNNSTDGQNNDSNNSTTPSLPIPSGTVLQFLALKTDIEVSNFLSTMRTDDVNDNCELPQTGTLRYVDFGITNLSDNWLECRGQSLSTISYSNLYNMKKSLVNCNFSVLNTGIGFINNITDYLGSVEISKYDFVKLLYSSCFTSNMYVKYNNNPPSKIINAGFFVIIPQITASANGADFKIVINQTYVLRNCTLIGYQGNHSIFVSNNVDSFKILQNITVNRVDIFGYETYNPNWNQGDGVIIPDVNNSFINITNAIIGVGIQISDSIINGIVQFEFLYKHGFKINSDGSFSLPDVEGALLTNGNNNLSFVHNRYLSVDNIRFEQSLPLPQDEKSYQVSNNYVFNNTYYSNMMSKNYSDLYPSIYNNLVPIYTKQTFGVGTYIFLVPFFLMLYIGLALGPFGLELVATATTIIGIYLGNSTKISYQYFLMYLTFENNNLSSFNTQQQSINLYRLYVRK